MERPIILPYKPIPEGFARILPDGRVRLPTSSIEQLLDVGASHQQCYLSSADPKESKRDGRFIATQAKFGLAASIVMFQRDFAVLHDLSIRSYDDNTASQHFDRQIIEYPGNAFAVHECNVITVCSDRAKPDIEVFFKKEVETDPVTHLERRINHGLRARKRFYVLWKICMPVDLFDAILSKSADLNPLPEFIDIKFVGYTTAERLSSETVARGNREFFVAKPLPDMLEYLKEFFHGQADVDPALWARVAAFKESPKQVRIDYAAKYWQYLHEREARGNVMRPRVFPYVVRRNIDAGASTPSRQRKRARAQFEGTQ